MKTLFFSFLIFCFAFQTSEKVSDKVVAYCLQNMGKQVDRGECWDLASSALKAAKAKWKAPFDFGTPVDWKKKPLQAGDVLQFTDVKLYGKGYSMYFPQHTAIVYKCTKKDVVVFHQNYNNKRSVDTLTMHLADLKNGKIDAYRPVAQ